MAEFAPLTLAVQTNSVRTPTLKECMRIALAHNLDIKIERNAPQIADYQISVAYSAYEPTASPGPSHSYSWADGEQTPLNFQTALKQLVP